MVDETLCVSYRVFNKAILCMQICFLSFYFFFMPMFWDSRVSTNLVDNYEIHVDFRN